MAGMIFPTFAVVFLKRTVLVLCLLTGGLLPAKEVTLDELMQVQRRVQAAFEPTRRGVVAIECSGGTASGVIVSPTGLVLTAAHVTLKPGKKVKIVLYDGRTVEGRSLGLDEATDAAMVQMPASTRGWPFVAVNREVRSLNLGDWCYAIGNPGGWDAARGPVLRVGKVVKITSNMLQSDCVLMGGDSGGALFDLSGQLIGIHSRIWRGLDQNLHVSMAPYLRSWDAMKKGEVIQVWARGSGGWMGLSTELVAGALHVQAVAPESPALKAGLKAGDIILSLNNKVLAAPVEFTEAIRSRMSGEIVTLKIRSGADERLVEVKLGKRPQD